MNLPFYFSGAKRKPSIVPQLFQKEPSPKQIEGVRGCITEKLGLNAWSDF